MNQSNPDFVLPEMPLPPELPPDEAPMPRDLPADVPGTPSALQWPSSQEFDTQQEAVSWAFYQHKAGGPKYFVQRLRPGCWEAIQAWMMSY